MSNGRQKSLPQLTPADTNSLVASIFSPKMTTFLHSLFFTVNFGFLPNHCLPYFYDMFMLFYGMTCKRYVSLEMKALKPKSHTGDFWLRTNTSWHSLLLISNIVSHLLIRGTNLDLELFEKILPPFACGVAFPDSCLFPKQFATVGLGLKLMNSWDNNYCQYLYVYVCVCVRVHVHVCMILPACMTNISNCYIVLSGRLGWVPTNCSEEADVGKSILQWLFEQARAWRHRLWELCEWTWQIYIQNNGRPSETIRHRACTNSLHVEI